MSERRRRKREREREREGGEGITVQTQCCSLRQPNLFSSNNSQSSFQVGEALFCGEYCLAHPLFLELSPGFAAQCVRRVEHKPTNVEALVKHGHALSELPLLKVRLNIGYLNVTLLGEKV